MSRTPRLRPDLLAAVAAALALGCYNPKIDEGAFQCGPGDSCPSGFSCKAARCYKNPPVTADAATQMDASCQQNERECSPATMTSGACDPVCQRGCSSCGDRCTHNGTANVCVARSALSTSTYDSCMPDRDTCAPGTVCLAEFNEQKCGAHCYRFCRVDSDCKDPGGNQIARCTGEAQKNDLVVYKHCSPRIEPCNPTGPEPRCTGGAPAERPYPAFACYMLSPQHPDEAVCECAGTVREGMPCTREYECVPGHECLQLGADIRCRKLCTPDGSLLPAIACGLGQRCMPFPGAGVRLGYCVPL
jgi:hypothetical protein